MRILLDQEGYSWDEAWHITTRSVAYTNHTVLAEALERWPQNMFENLLPRIWQIMMEISHRYEAQLKEIFHGDMNKVQENAVIWGGEVRMANLCVCGCFAINGVSALHSDILRRDVFHDICAHNPNKFKNVTNGIDHRRWLSEINPGMDSLLKELAGGDAYLSDARAMRKLE